MFKLLITNTLTKLYLKKTYFIFIFSWLLNVSLHGASTQSSITYDSVIIKTQMPTKAQEQKVFSRVNLDFAKKVENKDQDSLWDRFWNWLTDLIFGNSSEDFKQNIVTVFLWALAIAGIIIVIWLLTRTEFTSFLRGNIKNTAFDFSDVEEDIASIDFSVRIKKAVDIKEYRLAIRWYYLKQLNTLNDYKIIAYEPFKTNIDYGFELSKSPYQQAFKGISHIYDYVWYGKYDITLINYEKLEKQFIAFENNFTTESQRK